MIARDMTLSSLYDARDKLGELIVDWSPDPAHPELKDQLTQLLQDRDQMTGAINTIIDGEFAGLASPALLAAAASLADSAKQLGKLGAVLSDINQALKLSDQIIQGASKIIALI